MALRRVVVKNPHPTSDFQVIDVAGSGLEMRSRLHVYWASIVRSNGLLVEVQHLTSPKVGIEDPEPRISGV